MKALRLSCCLCVLLMAATPMASRAQRDPTVPPLGGGGGGGGSVKPRVSPSTWPVIVVDGRAHVAVGTRLYAEGEMLGKARIERITETEVWLREGRELRKVQIYPGVRRNALPPAQP